MTLLNQPIPPRPGYFGPDGAPPGVNVDLDAYNADWVRNRPRIVPRVLVVHTNGGSREANYDSIIRFSNGGDTRTHAHYNLNRPTPSKNLATDRRAIANSTPANIEAEYGERDCSFWTIAIETADRGTLNGGGVDLGDFLDDHAELVARIIAYESIVWNFPIEVPDVWNGSGVATHTEPFDGVYTLYRGKTCPGTTKKNRVLRGDIMPRARQIRDAWLNTPPTPTGADDMAYQYAERIYDSRTTSHAPQGRGGPALTHVFRVHDGPCNVKLNVTTLTSAAGYFSVAGGPDRDRAMQASAGNNDPDTVANGSVDVGTPDGRVWVQCTTPAEIIVDVQGVQAIG